MATGGWQIVWEAPARRALVRMPEKVGAAAVEFIYAEIARSPTKVGKPMRLDFEGCHVARRGDHRIVYRIERVTRSVHVVMIAHRADVYRRR